MEPADERSAPKVLGELASKVLDDIEKHEVHEVVAAGIALYGRDESGANLCLTRTSTRNGVLNTQLWTDATMLEARSMGEHILQLKEQRGEQD